MERSYEIRIYPNARQRELIGRTFGCCRYVYNRVLAMRQEEYGRNGKSRGIGSYMTQLPVWKKTDAPFLAEADSMALQQSLRDLDRAYQNFFRNPGRTGFPKFRSKHAGRRSYRTNMACVPDPRHVKLPKLGLVKARVSRRIEGRVLSATVKQVPSGRYFVCLCCTDCPEPEAAPGAIAVLGIDAGVHDLMARSDGVKVANPKALAKGERKLAREQRRLARAAFREGEPLVSILEDVLVLRACPRGAAALRPCVDVPCLRGPPRPRPQRSGEHRAGRSAAFEQSRRYRRACGNLGGQGLRNASGAGVSPDRPQGMEGYLRRRKNPLGSSMGRVKHAPR